MANTTPVARVSAVQGKAFAKGENGEMRELHVGDPIFLGDVLVTMAGAHVDLGTADGRTTIIQANETVTVDAEVAGVIRPDATDSALLAASKDTDTIIQAINQGGSLDDLLDETAAGNTGVGSDGGSSFVRLLRIAESVDPSGALSFSTGTGGSEELSYLPSVVVGSLQAGNENGTTTPTLTAKLDPTSDSGTVGDGRTSDSTPTISGTGEAGAKIDITVPGTNEHLTTTVATDGTWSVTPTTALPNGLVTLPVIETDAAGNTTTANVPVTIDTVATIDIRTIAVESQNPIATDADNYASISTADRTSGFTISGVTTGVETGRTITVDILNSANAVVGSVLATVGAGGAWTASVPANATWLADGASYSARATVSDVAGNVATDTDHLNAIPTNTVPASATVAEDIYTSIGGVSVADVDGGNLTTTLHVGSGSLSVAAGGGATINGVGSGTVTISGTAAQINAALAGLTYTGSHNYSGSDSLSVSTTDGLTPVISTVAVNVVAVADAPTLVISTATPAFTVEHTQLVVNPGTANALVITDGAVVLAGSNQKLWGYADYIAAGGNVSGTDSAGDIFMIGDTVNGVSGVITQNWQNNVHGINGAGQYSYDGKDYLILGKAPSAYTITYSSDHNGTTDGKVYSGYDNVYITDKSTGYTVSVANNVEDIIFGDGSTLSGDSTLTSVVKTVSGYYTYSLNLAAALTDTDGSEALSSITLTGIPAGVTLNHGTVQANGSWVLTASDLSGLTMKVPSSVSSSFDINAAVTSTESSNGSAATTTAVLHINSAPTVTIGTDANNDGYINSAEQGVATTDAVSVGLPAGAVAGDTLTISNGTSTQTHQLTATEISSGHYDTTFAKPAEGGTLTVTATITNASGVVSPAGSDHATLDTTAPSAPTLTVSHVADTQLVSTSWESATNSDSTSQAVAGTTFEGWTRVDTPDKQSGGSNAFEVWTTGDTQHNDVNNLDNIIYAAPGNGNNFLELNDSGLSGSTQMVQTIGISHSVATTLGMVYQLSFDYAGRPGYGTAYTNVSILVDGVKVASYGDVSSATALDWKNVKLDFVGDGLTHTVTIETDPTTTFVGGRGAMIDDISITSYQGVAAANAADGSDTVVNLSNYVSASASSSSDSLSLTFSGLSSGTHIVTGSHDYIADAGGNIVIQGGELSSAVLHVDKSFVGDLHIGVTATETDAAGNATTTVAKELDLTVLAHSGTVVATDIVDSTGHIITGSASDDNGPWYSLHPSITGAHTSGDDLYGLAGNDNITGLRGNDVILGGAGNDTMTGGLGSDVFKWSLGDQGTMATPAVDVITDFDGSTVTGSGSTRTGGDILDLRDLLQGEVHTGTSAGNLTDFLHFSYNSTSKATTIDVHTHGQNQGGVDQQIVLSNIDLTNGGALTTDAAIIQDLLTKGKLHTD